MTTIQRQATPLPMPFSMVVGAGGFLFLSGVLPMDAQGRLLAGDIRAQTRAVIERIAANLAEVGASLRDVVRVTVWLSSWDDFAAFNEEYALHFGAALPARSTVQAVLFGGARIEIEAQAWLGHTIPP